MPLNIKNTEADKLARRLADVTGRSITDAVIYALREQLRREEGRGDLNDLAADLMDVGRHCAALPDLDVRSPNEILGYDERGVWSCQQILPLCSPLFYRSPKRVYATAIEARKGAARRTDIAMASVY